MSPFFRAFVWFVAVVGIAEILPVVVLCIVPPKSGKTSLDNIKEYLGLATVIIVAMGLYASAIADFLIAWQRPPGGWAYAVGLLLFMVGLAVFALLLQFGRITKWEEHSELFWVANIVALVPIGLCTLLKYEGWCEEIERHALLSRLRQATGQGNTTGS